MEHIGIFGTGLMGAPMARRLLEFGYDVTVFNRTHEKTRDLKNHGAHVASSPKTCINKSDTLILMMSDFEAINDVLKQVPPASFRNKSIIQMGTISPDESRQLLKTVSGNLGSYMEAPVLGSIPQAKSGTLILFFGGEQNQFETERPLLSILGNRLYYIGEVGQAAALKLAFNQLIVTLTAAFSMSLGYLKNKNIDIPLFMEILRDSSLYTPTFDKKLEKMESRQFENPNFPVKHMLKDLNLIIGDFNSEKIDTKTLTALRAILEETMTKGYGDDDYSALYQAVHPKKKKK